MKQRGLHHFLELLYLLLTPTNIIVCDIGLLLNLQRRRGGGGGGEGGGGGGGRREASKERQEGEREPWMKG